MAYRFLRLGTTPNYQYPNASAPDGALITAQAPVPAGNDDASDYSNLNVEAASDPVFIGDLEAGSVFLFSDTTCSADMLVSVGPTKTGPFSAIGSASTNPALASPVVVDVFKNGRAEYAVVTISSYVSGNPRALLVGAGY